MTQEELNEYLHYDELTGQLFWKKQSGKCKIGEEAGHVSADGYRYFGFKGKIRKTHRAIYLMKTGILPKYIDHKDHNRLNNKWDNLRPASMTDNNRNCQIKKNNRSGIVGVHWSVSRNKWFAMIWHESKAIPLGRFINKQDAINARKAAEIQYGYHFNHGRKL
jgi:hypothetical protein